MKEHLKSAIIAILENATDEELRNVWYFVTHRIVVKNENQGAAQA